MGVLIMSFDCPGSPVVKPNFENWEMACYPDNDRRAAIKSHKEKGLRSSIFFCKVNDSVDEDRFLLQKHLNGEGLLLLQDVPQGLAGENFWKAIQKKRDNFFDWLTQLHSLKKGNVFFSNGRDIVVYRGEESESELYCLRLKPPNREHHLESDLLTLDLSEPLDAHRTVFLISSHPFKKGNRQDQIQPQQMLVIRGGSLFWSSHQKGVFSHKAFQPIEQLETPFSSVQVEQAQNSLRPINIKSIIKTSNGVPLEYKAYKVNHITEYTYSNPVEKSRHILRLKPVEDGIQEVVRSTLSLSVEGKQTFYEDVFGNEVIKSELNGPYTSLKITTENKVKVYAIPPEDLRTRVERKSIPVVWMPWQRQVMLPYLLPPELPEYQLIELTDFALSFAEKGNYNIIDTLIIMNNQIHQDFSYIQGVTTVNTTPFEVYSTRQGVCQDFANLFICLARLLNIPSRYRVGYIHTGSQHINSLQSDASHAWVEVYLPHVGWRGFDPTNGCVVSQDHIRMACGRNYLDAAPVAGTLFRGGGNERLSVSVKVEVLDEA